MSLHIPKITIIFNKNKYQPLSDKLSNTNQEITDIVTDILKNQNKPSNKEPKKNYVFCFTTTKLYSDINTLLSSKIFQDIVLKDDKNFKKALPSLELKNLTPKDEFIHLLQITEYISKCETSLKEKLLDQLPMIYQHFLELIENTFNIKEYLGKAPYPNLQLFLSLMEIKTKLALKKDEYEFHTNKIPFIKNIIRNLNDTLINRSIKTYDQHFSDFPEDLSYKLYIDYNRHYLEDPYAFDRTEPNYRMAMQTTFEYLRHTVHKRLDIDELIFLHDMCVTNVIQDIKTKTKFPKGLQTINNALYSYPLNLKNITQEALVELEDQKILFIPNEIKSDTYFCFFNLQQRKETPEEFLCKLKLKEHIFWISNNFLNGSIANVSNISFKEKIEEFIQNYHKELESATTERDKLSAIAKLCRTLEMFHCFPDGNQRTISFILLNKLLLQNDFSPCILKNPVMFDGYLTIENLITKIEEGMKIFENIKSRGYFLSNISYGTCSRGV